MSSGVQQERRLWEKRKYKWSSCKDAGEVGPKLVSKDGNLACRVMTKMKDIVDDAVKLAGLEALRTYVCGGEVCLRIRDSQPSESGARGHSGSIDVAAISYLALGTGKGKG